MLDRFSAKGRQARKERKAAQKEAALRAAAKTANNDEKRAPPSPTTSFNGDTSAGGALASILAPAAIGTAPPPPPPPTGTPPISLKNSGGGEVQQVPTTSREKSEEKEEKVNEKEEKTKDRSLDESDQLPNLQANQANQGRPRKKGKGKKEKQKPTITIPAETTANESGAKGPISRETAKTAESTIPTVTSPTPQQLPPQPPPLEDIFPKNPIGINLAVTSSSHQLQENKKLDDSRFDIIENQELQALEEDIMATGTAVSQRDVSNPFVEENTGLAPLLLERLDAWKHAVGYLEEYVEATATMHKGLYKDYEKILKTVADPLREGHHFSQNNGGIATLFENIRVNTQALAENQIETEKALKGQLLQTLARLHQEIKNKHKELSGGAFKGSKAVEKARGQTQKQIEHLGSHTASFQAAGGKIDPDSDPYIIRRGVMHHLNKQLIEENNHRKDLLEVQNNFLTFEKHVVETVQQCMQSFFQIVGSGCCDKMKTLYSDMMTTSQNIPPEFEWSNFLTQHGETLVDPKSPDRKLDMIKFANMEHGSTNAMVEGTLQRKGKIMRSYNTSYYAITPAGYMHEFKEGNDFKESAEPELSLYLPECAIGNAPQEGKFNISGKDANKNKNLTQKHEFRFKAGSQDEAMKWYDIASKFCTGTLTRQNSLMTPTSPASASSTAAALPPAYAEKHTESPTGGAAPVDTKAAPPAEKVESGTAPAKSATMSGAAPEKAPISEKAPATTSAPTSAAAPTSAEKAEIAGKNPNFFSKETSA